MIHLFEINVLITEIDILLTCLALMSFLSLISSSRLADTLSEYNKNYTVAGNIAVFSFFMFMITLIVIIIRFIYLNT